MGFWGGSRPMAICVIQLIESTWSSWTPAGKRSISRRQVSYHSPWELKLTIPCCMRPWSGRARAILSEMGFRTTMEG